MMPTSPRQPAAVEEGLRSLALRGDINTFEAARRIKFTGQDPAAALRFLSEEYDRTDAQHLLEHIGDLYVNLGQRAAAESLFRRLYYEGSALHVTNLIYAGLPATSALVDDEKGFVFIPIPKCGSSTVKNYFTTAIHGQSYGETVHFKHPELYRVVSAEDLATTYRNYFRFSVVREPVSRLVSYFSMNVSTGSLSREAVMEAAYHGFPTRPGPHKAAVCFHQYRQFFKDFRHHTDPISGYLDPFRDTLDKVYQMRDLPEIRDRISNAYGCTLEDTRAMVSKTPEKEKAVAQTAMKGLSSWYAEDSFYF